MRYFAGEKKKEQSKIITKKNVKTLYQKYCVDDKTSYTYELHGEWKKLD